MFFSRAIIGFFAAGAISVLAAASTVEKRQDVSDVLAVIGTLKSSTNSILPQLDGLVNSGAANEGNVSPLLKKLVGALDTSAVSLKALQGNIETSRGGTDKQVAKEIAAIFKNIAKSVNNLKTKKPHLRHLVPKFGLELALFKVLFGLQLVLVGVLKLVAVLLNAVEGLLSGLGFLLLGLLGVQSAFTPRFLCDAVSQSLR